MNEYDKRYLTAEVQLENIALYSSLVGTWRVRMRGLYEELELIAPTRRNRVPQQTRLILPTSTSDSTSMIAIDPIPRPLFSLTSHKLGGFGYGECLSC